MPTGLLVRAISPFNQISQACDVMVGTGHDPGSCSSLGSMSFCGIENATHIARLGEQAAAAWKSVNRRPLLANLSKLGVRISPPKQPRSLKPKSSATMTRKLGLLLSSEDVLGVAAILQEKEAETKVGDKAISHVQTTAQYKSVGTRVWSPHGTLLLIEPSWQVRWYSPQERRRAPLQACFYRHGSAADERSIPRARDAL